MVESVVGCTRVALVTLFATFSSLVVVVVGVPVWPTLYRWGMLVGGVVPVWPTLLYRWSMLVGGVPVWPTLYRWSMLVGSTRCRTRC